MAFGFGNTQYIIDLQDEVHFLQKRQKLVNDALYELQQKSLRQQELLETLLRFPEALGYQKVDVPASVEWVKAEES